MRNKFIYFYIFIATFKIKDMEMELSLATSRIWCHHQLVSHRRIDKMSL